MRGFSVAFGFLVASYWLLVGELSADEIALSVGGGALTALWAVALSRAGELRFRFRWKTLAVLAHGLADVPQAAVRLISALVRAGWRRPRGGFVEQPLDHGRDRSPAAATRRAVTLLAVSMSPDRFALLHEGDRLRLHRVGAGSPRRR